VVATNIGGSTEAKFNLNMLHLPPTFSTKFDKLAEIPEGQKLELKCIINGSPIPVVKWFKDGDEIIPDAQ
jgi:hypothetical protein